MSRRLTCLPLVAVLLLAAEAKHEVPKPPLTDDEQKLIEWTNKARAEKDLPPLAVNARLTAAARGHSANMAKKGEMSHVLDGKSPADRVKAAGYDYSYVGENIAVGENTPLEQVFKGWMESKPHRENILKPRYREIGVGIAKNDKGETYYTQVFGAPKTK
jgi:uncharacterized protein YkwD